MPLLGTRPIDDLERDAPEMESLDTESMVLEKVEILQAMSEIDAGVMEEVLPPALHPTIPPTVTVLFTRVPGGPHGPFSMAQVRIGCRAGVRPRGYLLSAVVDSEEAGRQLARRWGYRVRQGSVDLRRNYDRVTGTVEVDGTTILEVVLVDPEAVSGGDIFYIANMHPARTPMGPRLVQVDPEYVFHRAERGRGLLLNTFDAAAWGEPRLRPVAPVSASVAVADVTLPALRYVSRLDVPALQGTEKVR